MQYTKESRSSKTILFFSLLIFTYKNAIARIANLVWHIPYAHQIIIYFVCLKWKAQISIRRNWKLILSLTKKMKYTVWNCFNISVIYKELLLKIPYFELKTSSAAQSPFCFEKRSNNDGGGCIVLCCALCKFIKLCVS